MEKKKLEYESKDEEKYLKYLINKYSIKNLKNK
jgi:hypothetical protein